MISNSIKNYYHLTKPGIVYANTLSAIAGYLYASSFHILISKFIGLVLGTALLIASACVYNNYLDIPIDRLMARTEKRELPTEKISTKSAKIFLYILLALSIVLLAVFTNILTLVIGLISYFLYVFVYGYFKRYSKWGTLVGTLPGSASIIAGYVSYKNQLDLLVLFLLLVMASWQMAHFYAIAIYRLNDYKKSKLPIWPVLFGVSNTIKWIFFYMVMFMFFSIGMGIFTNAGFTFAGTMLAISYVWIYISVRDVSKMAETVWAKKVFKNSLIVNVLFLAAFAIIR